MNENIILVLEQILQKLEVIQKQNVNKEEPKVHGDDSLTVLSERLRNIEEYGPIINTNIANFSSSFGKLVDRINSYEPVNETKIEYNHVFFPGIQSWLHTLNKSLIVIILIIVVFGLSFLSYSLWEGKSDLKDEYYKFNLMKYYGGPIQFADSIYNSRTDLVIRKIDSLVAADEKEARLRNELDQTGMKYNQIRKELENTQ